MRGRRGRERDRRKRALKVEEGRREKESKGYEDEALYSSYQY